ncbi:MAG TPA: PaaI family thioesterase [Pyrinomonadaceae bacterium]|nr:PaaI family thioesterase [Pyrinomonadaceae bacterium]
MSKILDAANAMIRGEVPQPPVGRLIGFELVSIEPGSAVIQLEATEAHRNPMGTLHGGVLCDIADAAMGMAYASNLNDGESFTTLELKINFLKPVWNARLTATGRVVKQGRTVGMIECDVVDEKGSLVARATSTCMTLRGALAEGR